MSEPDDASRLYEFLQTRIQLSLFDILDESIPLAEAAGASIVDVVFCAGTSVASMVFEISRSDNQTFGLTAKQEELMKACQAVLSESFEAKMDYLRDQENTTSAISDINFMPGTKTIN